MALRCSGPGSSLASAAMPSTLSTDSNPSRMMRPAMTERPASSSCGDIDHLSYASFHFGYPSLRMSSGVSGTTVWRIIAILSVVEAGAYVGNETARYFWDLTAYVGALDTDFPWRFEDPYPFLYPPFAKDLFTLARSHLFELLAIVYVGAIAFFLATFAQLTMPRRFEWLFAITAMGGLGVVSLLAGNVAIVMNLAVLALAL